jgi:hypothetical protein
MIFQWTQPAMDELVRRALCGESATSIAAQLGCTPTTVRKKMLSLGVRERRARHVWTAQEIDFVREMYPHVPTVEVARHVKHSVNRVMSLAQRLKLHKSAEYCAAWRAASGALLRECGIGTRFKKGFVPTNKGTRRPGWSAGRMKETQFKKGERRGAANSNWVPVGTVRPDHDGFLRIKIREQRPEDRSSGFGNPDIWPLLHRHTWEQHKGPIPPGHNIAFKDRNRQNCEIDNLECITKKEQMRRNTIHNRYPAELRNTILLLGAMKRRLREYAKEHDDASSEPFIRNTRSVKGRRETDAA